jgi:hypothetical protein
VRPEQRLLEAPAAPVRQAQVQAEPLLAQVQLQRAPARELEAAQWPARPWVSALQASLTRACRAREVRVLRSVRQAD